MKLSLFKILLIICFFVLGFKNAQAVNTFYWRGGTAIAGVYNWTTVGNWYINGTSTISVTYPGQLSATDAVVIGNANTFTGQPTLNTATSVASITFGSASKSYNGTYYVYSPVILTVTGVTLTTGSIQENHTAGAVSNYSYFLTTLAGTGTINCTGDFQVGSASFTPPNASGNVTAISSTIAQLTVSGNLIFNSRGSGYTNSNASISYPYFSLDQNQFTLLGQMKFVAGNSPLTNGVTGMSTNYHVQGGFAMDTYPTPATLELKHPDPIVTNTNFAIDFTNGGNAGTVIFDDPTSTDLQNVYTTATTAVGTLPYNFINLTVSGASAKVVAGSALTIGNVWNTSGGSIDLVTNDPDITVSGNWINSANVNQDAGDLIINGNLINSANTISLGKGDLTLGGNMNITGGTIKGSTTTGTTKVTGGLTNSGTLTCNAEDITFNGASSNNATITCGTGDLIFNNTYLNSAGALTGGAGLLTFGNTFTANGGSVTTGSGTASFQGNYTNGSGGAFTAGAGSVVYTANYTNSGTFTAGSGTVHFSKNGSQTLLDNSTGGTTFNNVTCDGTSGTSTVIMTAGLGNFAVSAAGTLAMVSPSKLVAGSTTVGGAAYLTLRSNATATATVSAISGSSSIKGNVNVQRYLTGGTSLYRGYRLMSSPTNISLNASGSANTTAASGAGYLDLKNLGTSYSSGGVTYNGAFTAGPGTGFFSPGGTPNPIIYLYDESKPTNNSSFVSGKNIGVYTLTNDSTIVTYSGIPAVQTPNQHIPVGNSYIFYFIGDNSNSLLTRSAPENTTTTSSGYLNQGNINVKFWNTNTTTIPFHALGLLNGLNQVGNPYASTINLDVFYTDNHNSITNPIGTKFWELDPTLKVYISYSYGGATSNTRASKYIVSGQGFIMQAGALSPIETITFKEDQKVAYPAISTITTPALEMGFNPGKSLASNSGTTAAFTTAKQTDAVVNPVYPPAPVSGDPASSLTGLHLQLTKDSVNYTQTGIYFDKTWSDDYQFSEDAMDLDGNGSQVFLSSYSSDNSRLCINQLGDYIKGKTVKLFVNTISSGAYVLNLADIQNLNPLYTVYLRDHLNKDSVDLKHTNSYNFNIDKGDSTTFGSNRFDVVIAPMPVPKYELLSFAGEKVTAGVQLTWKTLNEGNYTGFGLQKLVNGTYITLDSLQSDSLTNYDYTDQHPLLGANIYRLSQNDIKGNVTYSAPVTIGYNSTDPNGSLNIYPNPSKSMINVSLTATSVNKNYVAGIYSISGEKVKQTTVSSSKWVEDISSYKSGIYVIQIKDVNGNLIGQSKFVKVD